jgi:hypothetical protein
MARDETTPVIETSRFYAFIAILMISADVKVFVDDL